MIKLVFLIVATGLYFLFRFLQKRNFTRRKYKLPDEIKNRYKKISFLTDKMEILANDYFEEDNDAGHFKIKAIDALYDNERNYTQVHKFASVIVYNDYLVLGKKYRLRSETIDLRPDDIEEKLRKKETIDIYLDEKNIKNHYFDLSFLAL